MSKGSATASRFSRYIRAPIRALCSVRDLYVKSMTGCAGRVQNSGGAMGAYPSLSEFGHSYSFRSARSSDSDEDLRELIRAASLSRARSQVDAKPVRRSQSVAVGRIDEEEPCDFKGEVEVGSDLLFPRSRSVAVGTKRRMMRAFA